MTDSAVLPPVHQAHPVGRRLASNGYRCEPRDTIDVKGEGQMETWLLAGRAERTG